DRRQGRGVVPGGGGQVARQRQGGEAQGTLFLGVAGLLQEAFGQFLGGGGVLLGLREFLLVDAANELFGLGQLVLGGGRRFRLLRRQAPGPAPQEQQREQTPAPQR